MGLKLLSRFGDWFVGPEREFRVPDGLRIYAIGDIHGRADLLAQIAGMVATDLENYSAVRAVTVFLGDYVDRGPDTPAVLERLASGDFPTPFVSLRGNHEAMLLAFLLDPDTGASWRNYGGIETLHSYGLDVRDVRAGRGYAAAAQLLHAALPSSHLQFLQHTRNWYTAGDYFFCHAGVRPKIPFASQQEYDLLWIRDSFLSYTGAFEKLVVHGHTPVMSPDVRPNRINIDTGAYVSGRLTCLVLENATRRFLTTGTPYDL